jgi:hypothetical protein
VRWGATSRCSPLSNLLIARAYTYEAENTGSAGSPALENVVVTDDNDTGDDFNPTFTGGDLNSDGKLDVGVARAC